MAALTTKQKRANLTGESGDDDVLSMAAMTVSRRRSGLIKNFITQQLSSSSSSSSSSSNSSSNAGW